MVRLLVFGIAPVAIMLFGRQDCGPPPSAGKRELEVAKAAETSTAGPP
jgi:hypothetical protein